MLKVSALLMLAKVIEGTLYVAANLVDDGVIFA